MKINKVGCVFLVLSSDFRMGQHRDDDYQEDAPHFIKMCMGKNTNVTYRLKVSSMIDFFRG